MRTVPNAGPVKDFVRVLLVEGDVRDARALRSVIAQVGTGLTEVNHVRTLHGATDALEKLATDVVLTAPRLPDAAGSGVIETLVAAARDIPVVVIGAPGDALTAIEAIRLGAQDHLVKGEFDAPTLWRSIKHARDRRRLACEREGALAARDEAWRAFRDGLAVDETAVAIVGADLRLRWVNPPAAALWRARAEVVVGHAFPHALIPGSKFAFTLERGAEGPVALRAQAHPLVWDGEPAFLVRLHEDVATAAGEGDVRPDRQRMEAVGRLASNIAHDVNNLLTALHVATNLAAERIEGAEEGRDEEVARRLATIEGCAGRAEVLVRQLIEVSRRRHARPAAVDVHALLEEMRPILRSALGDSVRVTSVPRARHSWVWIDEGGLEDAVLNLALHAHDAMRASGGAWFVETEDVELGAEEAEISNVAPGSFLRVSFSDTSPGIDVERLPRLFDPHSGSYGPTIGLAEAGAIIRSAGGSLEVESAPGSGTTFRMLLPRTARPEAARQHPPAAPDVPEAPPPRPERPATILLVEDMPELREIARDAFTAVGYRVIEAGSGDEGLRKFVEAKEPIDLVVTDVVMPGSTGPDMVRAIRERRPEARALFMSSRTSEDLALLWRVSADDPCLEKPFRQADLLRKVAEALARAEEAVT